jgi:hypothetical protein
MTNDLSELDVFYGDLSSARAYVYARLPRSADDAGLTLSGHVRGPRCLHAQTLPAIFPLMDLGPGPTLLARAVVPEPTFWSPDLPAIYDVTVHVQHGSEIVASRHAEIGLKAFGVRGQDFFLEGKRVVLRGVRTSSTTATLPRDWHAAAAAFVADEADFDHLTEASQWGALSVVAIKIDDQQAIKQIRELAQFPAVAIVAVVGSLPEGFSKVSLAPNLLLAQFIGAERVEPRPWADVLLVDAANASLAARWPRPVIVTRFLRERSDLPAARLACDALQRELAPSGQFAGYII